MLESIGAGDAVTTGVTISSVYLILRFVVIPKLNTLCIRTARMEITESVLLDVACEDHPDDDIRGRIIDEINRAGIPRQNPPLRGI